MMLFLMVAGGLLLLFVGGELMVRGSVALARRAGVSPMLIGLSVVSAGTSAPELFVSLFATLEDAPGIAIGNVVGSNIANILLVLGAAGLVYPLVRKKHSIYRDGTVLVGASIAFVLLCLGETIGRAPGIVMLVLLAAYLVGCYFHDRRNPVVQREIAAEIEELGRPDEALILMLAKIAFGIAGIVYGAEILVDGSVALARIAGISETVIGLTIIAIGTSLPELAAAVIAARHGHTDLALGNAIGSCIFNILAIVGTVAIVVPIAVPGDVMTFDIWVMLAVAVAFVLAMAMRSSLPRWIAAGMLLLYAGYTTIQFVDPADLLTSLMAWLR